MTEDKRDLSNVRIFNKEIENKKNGDVYTMYFVMFSIHYYLFPLKDIMQSLSRNLKVIIFLVCFVGNISSG